MSSSAATQLSLVSELERPTVLPSGSDTWLSTSEAHKFVQAKRLGNFIFSGFNHGRFLSGISARLHVWDSARGAMNRLPENEAHISCHLAQQETSEPRPPLLPIFVSKLEQLRPSQVYVFPLYITESAATHICNAHFKWEFLHTLHNALVLNLRRRETYNHFLCGVRCALMGSSGHL